METEATESDPQSDYFLPRNYRRIPFPGSRLTIVTEHGDPLLYGLLSRCCCDYATPEGGEFSCGPRQTEAHKMNFWKVAQIETHCVEWLYVFKRADTLLPAFLIHSAWMADN